MDRFYKEDFFIELYRWWLRVKYSKKKHMITKHTLTKPRSIAFLCFILSGVASISYQLLWLRSAISYFGVITPVISILLSTFMLGLAVGTYIAGKLTLRLSLKGALISYGIAELCIAVLALMVPHEFVAGYNYLLTYETLDSTSYLLFSALIIAAALFLPCVFIGATMPLMMKVLEQDEKKKKNFGVLYLSNLIGALVGCILPLILIEWVGQKTTLQLTTLFNLGAFLLAAWLLWAWRSQKKTRAKKRSNLRLSATEVIATKYQWFLFLIGFVAIGSELLWVKAFAPVTSSSVYSYAIVLGVYLCANIAGNYVYLRTPANTRGVWALAALPFTALLIIPATTMWALSHIMFFIIASIIPVSFLCGYLTPQIIDNACKDKPHLAAKAYIYNFAGCILGPLFAGYFLFPSVGLKLSFIILATSLALAVLLLLKDSILRSRLIGSAAFAICVLLMFVTVNYEDNAKKTGVLYRDPIGYIAATGQGMTKALSVNGIGMTRLSMITKNMVHFPAAYHTASPAHSILIVCMGMGTTLRSAVAWPFDSITQVELSPGVTRTFPYFHNDASKVLNDPRVKLVLDDGRRYLLRHQDNKYDIITIDPPPPMKSSASGLLYSTEFMSLISSRLNEGGILAHWIPEDRVFLTGTILKAIRQNFKYIKIFHGIDGHGIHIIASNSPLPALTVEAYINRLPAKAKADLFELPSAMSPLQIFQKSLREADLSEFVQGPDIPAISDDRLYNEFFVLRKLGLVNSKD